MNATPHSPKAPHRSPPANVILTGFMGTGKSTVGRALAERLGWAFLDTDERIERRAGKPVSRIFAEDGEPAFRKLESAVAREIGTLARHVIATGGGMALDPENLRALEAAGALVLLTASTATVFERVAHETHRPLLAQPDPRGEIERLLAERREAYGRVAIRIATDGRAPEAVVEEILERTGATRTDLSGAPNTQARVELGERAYLIEIGRGWIESLGQRLAPHFPPRPCVLVTEPRIGALWGRPVVESLRAGGYEVDVCEIPGGERHKSVEAVSRIHDLTLHRRHTRQSGIVALGGGIVGDVAGFAAATVLRGVAFIQLPTTLLAMVDSSVGGKTGVNHAMGKNLIGAFWQPSFVGAELSFLDTLDDAELRSGMAEVVKYGIIADAELFAWLEEGGNLERALARDADALSHLVRRSCEIKADVVARDEREAGLRAILNLGHTFGHAAEALSGYDALRHGEGVAMGMVAAARLAERRGLLTTAEADRIERLIARASLPTRLWRAPTEEYWETMRSDKKAVVGRVRFVLPTALGAAALFDDVTREEMLASLASVMDTQSRPRARPVGTENRKAPPCKS